MRLNYETLDVDKVQDRVTSALFVLTATHRISSRCCPVFVVIWLSFLAEGVGLSFQLSRAYNENYLSVEKRRKRK